MNFGQVNLHLYANSTGNEALRNKLLSEYGISHAKTLGYCYGLSNEYLMYAANNQHIDYIKQLSYLLDVVNDHQTTQDSLSQSRSDALKIHAKALLNEFIFDAVKHQEIYESSVRNYNYFEQTTYEDINGRNFKDYIDYVINTTYEDSQFKGEYYESIVELQKIKTQKYYFALIADDDFFKSKEGLEISKDPFFMKLKSHFSDINSPIDKHFTKHDAKIFLKVIFNDIQRDNYNKVESFNMLRGMKREKSHKGSKYDDHLKKEISLNEFIMKLNNETSHGHDPLRYKFCSSIHVMAITADFNTETKSWNFTFFDPNTGIKKYENKEEFFGFLKNFVLNKSDDYSFIALKNNDFKIGYYKYNYDVNISLNLNKLNESEINVTENTLLAEREVSVPINDRDKIVYNKFNPEKKLTTVKAEINSKSFYIHTDIIDSFELKNLIEINSRALSELGSDIFISHNEGLVYKVDKNFDINDFNIESKVIFDLNNTNVNYNDINLELRPINSDDRKIITGIPESHQKVITKIANEENIIIGIRPVDKKSTSLILSGEYSSKGLNIKSKSSDWGPHCGFIPVLQEYAKRSGRENKNKYNLYTQQAIDNGYAKSTILELTPERVNELTVYNEITPLEKVNGSEYSKTISILDGQEKVFLLKKINRDGKYFWHVYHEDEGNIKPFHVIADPITEKALTADYDLFSIIFPISELEHYVKVGEMPTWAEWKASVNFDELTLRQKVLYANEAEYNKHEGRDNGITNNRIKEIKNKLNKGLDRINGMELIHHGADDANPASVMKENFPITFFLPEKLKARNALTGSSEAISTYFQMNAQGAIIINDVEQLSNFQQLLINQGYRAPLNKKWSEGDIGQYFDPKRKISDSFIEGRIELARKKSLANPFELNVDVAAIQQQSQHYDSEMERQLGKPVAQLDTGFDDVYLQHMMQSHSEFLAGERSQTTDSIDQWQDPMSRYQELMKRNTKINRTVKPTQYDHNLLILLSGDDLSAWSAAYLFAKHSNNSVISLFDSHTKEFKVPYGDINRLKTGKIRIITIGHGYYLGDNEPSTHGGISAKQYVDDLLYLKHNLLGNRNPDKLVMLACNLSRGGVNENFAMKAVSIFAEHKMYMPVTAYNRPVKNTELGAKIVQPTSDSTENVSTKGYKFVYQYHPETQQIRVNGQLSTLFFINEVRRGELSIDQLTYYTKPDHFSTFRDPGTQILDLNLLKKVIYNPEAYRLFVGELKKAGEKLPDNFYRDFTKKLNQEGMTSTPLWKMVDKTRIQKLSSPTSTATDSDLTMIIRLTGDEKGRQLAESWAAKNPYNTLIFQMDADAEKWTIEYGEAFMTRLVESPKTVDCLLIGDGETLSKSNINLVSGLIAVKQKYPFLAPEHILYYSISKGIITEGAEHRSFTSELEATLKQHGFNTKVLSKYTPERVAFSTTKGQQIQALFEKVALGEQDLNAIRLTDHPYLAEGFTDEHGNFDQRKFKIALHDPLVNAEYNQSLNKGETLLSSWLSESIESDLQLSHPQQAIKIKRLLVAIENDLSVLNNLSDHSIELLKSLFPAGDGIDKGKILNLVTDHNKFMLFSDMLDGFSQISDRHFDGENATLKGLSFSEALEVYENNQTQRSEKYNHLLGYQNKMGMGYHVGLINHGVIGPNGLTQSSDQTLGSVYAIEYYLTDSHKARDFLEQEFQLEKAKQKGFLSTTDNEQLIKIQSYNKNLNTLLSNSGITLAGQSISSISAGDSGVANGIIYLKGTSLTYTIVHTQRNGFYEYSLFDPQGVQFSIKNASLQAVQHQFHKNLMDYFNQPLVSADGESVTRGKVAGFQLMDNGDLRADIQHINLDEPQLKNKLSTLLNERTSIVEKFEINLSSNYWVELDGEKIPFAKLQNLGATIDGKPISPKDMALPNQYKKIRFSAEKLSIHFMLMEGGKDDVTFIKVFKEQLNSGNIYQLVEYDANFTESGVLKKQFKYLANDVDIQQEAISSSTLKKLRQVGTQLPLFHRVANRFGQGMGAAGAVQSIIGVYSILNRLNNPDITVEEAKELEKQLYLLCGSAFFNYGDMIIQPILLNIASSKGTTSLVRARIATGVVVVFNLVGMGIDIYQAYDNLSKLDSVTDLKQRQDLIVNASFSIVSAAVNGVTVIAVLVGSSTIPVAGLVVGGMLLVGGWIYNGVRAVKNIKTVIDISWGRELEEGIRGALGLEPTLRSQQEMSTQLYINAFKELEWQMDLAQFRNGILQAGYDHHLTIIEKPTYENEPRYYLVDNYGNHFYGTLGHVYHGMHTWVATYTAKGAPSFTEEEVEFIFANKVIRKTAWYRNLANLYGDRDRNLREHFRPHKKAKEVIDLKRTGSEPTHERYYLNSAYKNALLDEYQARHHISHDGATLSLQDQLAQSNPEQLSFYSKKREFGVLGQQILQENERLSSEHLVNDKKGISLYLKNPYSRGTSWNTGNGNDLLIGHQEQKNAFQVFSGEKYFAGGNKDDLFYIRDGSLTSLRSRGSNNPTKYLDGQQGQDMVVVDNIPNGYEVYANLSSNSLDYKDSSTHEFISVAHLQSIEHVIVKGNSSDRLHGNDMANILDGGQGNDLLIGDGGDDKLILTQGKAVGGHGEDSYLIRRFDWTESVDDLYLNERYWDGKLKAVKTKTTLNPIYQHSKQQYQVKVTIDESSESQSIVNLEYSLNEIKRVYLQGDNLYLIISPSSSKVGDYTYSNIDSSVTIVLNNVTRLNSGVRETNHTYRLHTKDGFMMTTQIKELEKGKPTQFFNISYIQENDQIATSGVKSVKIDETINSIIINKNRHHIAPSWGWFTPIGRADNLVYQGDDKSNSLLFISSGSYIHVSRGIDTYQVIHGEDERSTVTFDFASINGPFTKDDKILLLLPTDNGYALSMEGLTLYSKDKFGQRQLTINFVNVNDTLADAILIQDKNSNVFSLDLQTQSLSPLQSVPKSSENDDIIVLPTGYLSDKHVIDGKGGDDIIINKSGESYILKGGEGDDCIAATYKNNVLYGGTGTNFLSGGEGDDVLLSDKGNDTLKGGAGNDHSIIDGNYPGAVYLEDDLGDNHVHLINFKQQAIKEFREGILYHTYVSPAGKIVQIKQLTDDSKASNTVHHYDKLNAKYDSLMRNGMAPLVDYLSAQHNLAKQSGRLATWKPANELAGALKGIAKPLNLTAGDDGILINTKTSSEYLVIDMSDGNDEIVDESSQGRVIKGGNGNDKLICFNGENVLYGGEGDDTLLAQGIGQDVLISLTGNDKLSGGKGDDLYIVSGHGQGNVVINDFEGRNQVALLGFKVDAIRYQEVSPDTVETIYQSYSGRTVTIRHNNHQGSMANVMQVSHLNNHPKLSQPNVDLTIDRLIQLLAEQRIEHESNLEHQSRKTSSMPYWGAVSTTEHFLNVL
ncbi:anthrax toxin-like adenylyl cyclase domain-containing protein [Providencia sp. JUb39]|uniref:anthrax toxin-like adenylyl cyclase domain-containing protein n=1 Tax=Providencia sp. JUb39 TaxID=2724165 RepID=UPI00164DACA2|nr:anthrax toxin-like adenylyl cyclase domain-containing protein [Providencia sp. JUb39]MBC5789848.1 RTX toxin [Providencia sp. JUb39]